MKELYSFGDFQLDPLRRELRQKGMPVTIPSSAFDCLVYLVDHRERPVGKDELISAVWGRTTVSDNLLAQTIVRLRKTIRGTGKEKECISGQLSSWSRVDWRAAWTEACVYQAIGQTALSDAARSQAQRLAGERVLTKIHASLCSRLGGFRDDFTYVWMPRIR